MKHAVKLACTVVLAILCAYASVLADVPTAMNVQGRLTDNAGAPVAAGLKNFTFKIYDAPAGGIEVWPGGAGETQALVTDANGLWNGRVGQLIPLTEAVFQSPVRWLEVKVDDGINPAEVLPRIELKTVPYTYRAATSQQADSLGGMSLDDLMDKFVDEAADTMSGQLRIDWNHANTGGPNLEINNVNNAYLPPWNTFAGTWAGVADANADGSSFNVGLGGSAQGDNTTNQGLIGYSSGVNGVNYGLYGLASGATSVNYGVYGVASGGTDNFAGYFIGDLAVISAPGDQSVQLPPDAISSGEILNEPGLAAAQSAGSVVLSCGVSSDLLSVSITIPGSGYIVVDARCTAESGSSTGGTIGGAVAIDEVGGAPLTSPSFFQQQLPTGGFYFIDFPVSTYRIYFKNSGGTYTFHLNGTKFGNCAAAFTSTVSDFMMRATYYATSYGTVATLASADEAGQFDEAQPVAVATGPDRDAPTVTMYQVDLRELELKVVRAEAEAEKARRELVEAQLSAVRRPGQAPSGTVEDHKQ